jgi:hypothetical protein
MSLNTREKLVDTYNRQSYPTEPIEADLAELRILNGLLLYYVLTERDLILPKRDVARFDKAKLSGRVFQDAFERLFKIWTGGRDDIFLADVDSMIKGLDYVIACSNPVQYKAGIQCRFSVSGSTPTVNNHYSKLRKNLSEARKQVGHLPLAAVVFRTESNVPEPLAGATGADHSTIFLNHSGRTGLAIRIREIRSLAHWVSTR